MFPERGSTAIMYIEASVERALWGITSRAANTKLVVRIEVGPGVIVNGKGELLIGSPSNNTATW